MPAIFQVLRFMRRGIASRRAGIETEHQEGLLSLLCMRWDHEPVQSPSSQRESAQISPLKYERTHVRCYKVYGKLRDQEPVQSRSSRRESAQISPRSMSGLTSAATRFMESFGTRNRSSPVAADVSRLNYLH